MIGKPKKCCDCGTYQHQVHMPIRGRVCGIDICIADIVAALNVSHQTLTVGSCCGHGTMPGHIMLEDGRELIIIKSVVERNKVFNMFTKGGKK